MTINPHLNKSTFNETYYRMKFEDKKNELLQELNKNPKDYVVIKQIEFIDRITEQGNASDEKKVKINWGSVWNEWEKREFMPRLLYFDDNN